MGSLYLIAHALRGEGFDASEDGTGRGVPLHSLGTNSNATGRNATNVAIGRSEQLTASVELAGAVLRGGDGGRHEGVRCLTPRECERLQGFPDDYTRLNAKTADAPRYKALGNSMAVPVMRWIGERIAMVERIG